MFFQAAGTAFHFFTSKFRLIAAPRDDHFFEHDVFARSVARIPRYIGDGHDYFLAFHHLAKDAVFAIEKGRGLLSDEKLAAVGIGSRIRHGKDTGFVVPQLGTEFVFEFITRAAGSVAQGITALNHEAWNDAVKNRSVVKRALHFVAGFGI